MNASGIKMTKEFMNEKNRKPERVENIKPIKNNTMQMPAFAIFPDINRPLRYTLKSISVSSMLPNMLSITFMPTHANIKKKRNIHSLEYLKVENAAGYVMKIRSMPSAGKLLMEVLFMCEK